MMIDKRMLYSEIERKSQIKYCIYENYVLSLENFFHPGGNYMTASMHGREIDRFIEGGYSLEKFLEVPPYEHSSYINVLL